MSEDLSKVRHVITGDPVSGPVTSQPTKALELRIKALEDLLFSQSSQTESGRIIIRNVDVQTGVGGASLWDIVYYNAATGLYEPGLAGVNFTAGVFAFNPTALALGVLVTLNGSKGDVMILGYETWVDNDSRKITMLESTDTFKAGVPYYLSDREPGKLTRFAPSLRVQILIASDKHFVLQPTYSSPEAIENIYRVGIGMRPVGSIREIGPDYTNSVIVGFDALENYDTTQKLWRSTRDGISVHQKYGYLVADADVSINPSENIFVRVEVTASTGAIRVYSAKTLVDLVNTGSNIFNNVASLSALNSNASSLRTYAVQDSAGTQLGTLQFKFVDNDVTYDRHVIFKFPDSFQGWKMIYAPVNPIATATVANGAVTKITVQEGSIGYNSVPTVVISGGGGTGATAVAVLNELGSITSITITAPGTGYTSAPTIAFTSNLSALSVLNGGSGATATIGLSTGALSAPVITAAGSGYLSPPSVEVIDTGGSGFGGIVTAEVQGGVVTKLNIVAAGASYVTPVLRILPSNSGYFKTKAGVFVIHTTTGTITSITITDGGLNYPKGAQVKISSLAGGTGAAYTVTVNGAGTITAFNLVTAGSGYDDTSGGNNANNILEVDTWDPKCLLTGATPTTAAVETLGIAEMGLDRVEILSSGIAYGVTTTITVSGAVLNGGGTHATVKPIMDAAGRIVEVRVLTRGSGYFDKPTLTINDSGSNGNNASLSPVLGTVIQSATIVSAGAGYDATPIAQVTVPVDHVEVEDGGTGYSAAPALTFSVPEDPLGRVAAGTAVLGGVIARVNVLTGGTGYALGTTATPTGGGGSAVQGSLKLNIVSGVIQDVEIVDPGSLYDTAPSISLGSVGGGAGATFQVVIEAISGGTRSVVKVTMTDNGKGYVEPPTVTAAAPGSGATARLQAKLRGIGGQLKAAITGEGGLHMPQSVAAAAGNNLQVSTFGNDLDDSSVVQFTKPVAAAFYFNRKADPNFKLRYPATPVDKATLVLNGAELITTLFQEGVGTFADIDADLGLSRKTLFWPTFDQNSCPWQSGFKRYWMEAASDGRDHIIQATGYPGQQDYWWRFSERVFSLEPYRNRAWLHINKASKFHQTSRVAALGAIAPLRLIDAATGVDARSDGAMMSGQLLLVLDDQVNLLGGTMNQLDLTKAGELQPIFLNSTGRNVFVTSVILVVVFQSNQGNLIPTTANNAKVTIGTQAGNYRNIVGVAIDESTAGVATRLFAINQGKELFPDSDQSYTLIQPNETIYLKVDLPAGTPIVKQIAVAHLKGHIL